MNKEYMLYIRNQGDAKANLSSEDHLAFIRQCEVYIGKLKSAGQLIAAQPILREGVILKRVAENWVTTAIEPAGEVQVGYYHICADDLNQAIAIAKENPEFNYVPSASIEVRPIKMKEEQTNFVYPK